MEKIIKIIEDALSEQNDLLLNHIYDMGELYLFSVRTKKEKDLMNAYYVIDKKTYRIKSFAFQNHIDLFKNALKNRVY